MNNIYEIIYQTNYKNVTLKNIICRIITQNLNICLNDFKNVIE